VRATVVLAPVPESARHARQFITDFCSAANLPAELCHTAALLVSELVTNAILHGRSSATLEAHRPPGLMRVAVRDDNPALPEVGSHPDFGAESGRGLMIVSMLAPRWGVEPVDGGKAIWFELDVPAVG
jgi:anti-sigma regulatory factor (Ser/Thr protein kinase)